MEHKFTYSSPVKRTLFIHATNVHQGGGGALLFAILEACPKNIEVVALLDKRMRLPATPAPNLTIVSVKPSVLHRFMAEWWLARHVQADDIVLCFGNLPPLFRLCGHVSVFIQNRFLIDKVSLKGFSFRIRLRISIERLWLSLRAHLVDEFIVQTSSMQSALLSTGYVGIRPIHIRPFVSIAGHSQQLSSTQTSQQPSDKKYDFVYIASGEPHKNHHHLIKAWGLLAEEGIFPSLCLTLDRNSSPDLCAWIDNQKLCHGLKIENVGNIAHEQVMEIYTLATALIYPSLFESFGIPLIEASQVGIPVLAAELDYVRDIIDPVQSFDPKSPISIAKAVKRFIGIEAHSLPLVNAGEFIDSIIGKAN
jgi:glycosyltransferase involved in cell wall biosynthesis